jgi:hypothetical protein
MRRRCQRASIRLYSLAVYFFMPVLLLVLPVETLVARGARRRFFTAAESDVVAAIRFIVARVGRYMIWYRPQRCLRVSLVAFFTLSAFGVPATIVFGVRLADADLLGHSWVVLADGRTVYPDPQIAHYLEIWRHGNNLHAAP